MVLWFVSITYGWLCRNRIQFEGFQRAYLEDLPAETSQGIAGHINNIQFEYDPVLRVRGKQIASTDFVVVYQVQKRC